MSRHSRQWLTARLRSAALEAALAVAIGATCALLLLQWSDCTAMQGVC